MSEASKALYKMIDSLIDKNKKIQKENDELKIRLEIITSEVNQLKRQLSLGGRQ